MNVFDHMQKFNEKELRCFFSKESEDAYVNSGYTENVGRLETQIKELQRQLEHAKKYVALKTLISERGWSLWDVSDEIPYTNGKFYPFVGTETEYNLLIDRLKQEQKQNV